MAEIEFKQSRIDTEVAKDGGAHLDCERGFIWFHYQLAFLFHRKDFLPTSFSMNSNILLLLHELSAKQHKSYQVTFIKFLSRERRRGDFPSLHHEFIQIPTLDADLCQS
jgi:hypothetical protein